MTFSHTVNIIIKLCLVSKNMSENEVDGNPFTNQCVLIHVSHLTILFKSGFYITVIFMKVYLFL